MSYGLIVYAVDLDKLEGACGSRDEGLYSAIVERFRYDLEQNAEYFEAEIAAGAPAPIEALRRLIHGEPIAGHGFMYAYALELIIRHLGQTLDNSSFYPCDPEFLEEVDAALADFGAPDQLQTESLQFGELPVAIPAPDDFPGFGHWPAALVSEAHETLAEATWPEELDASLRENIVVVQGWLREAASRGLAIVGFYY